MGEVVQLQQPPKREGRGLSLKQRKALRFINAHLKLHGTWPPDEAVGAELGLHSVLGVERVVSGLIERGMVPPRVSP